MAVADFRVQITVNPIHLGQVRELLRGLESELPQAVARAINATGKTVKSKVVKAIAADLKLKQKDINVPQGQTAPHRFGGVSLRMAHENKLEAAIAITGQRIPLFRFGARRVGTKRKPRGVSYQIGRDEPRKTIPAFLATMASGHEGVFRRRGMRRFPIRELKGPSIPHAAQNRPALKQMLDLDASDLLELNLARQIDYLLRRNGRG